MASSPTSGESTQPNRMRIAAWGTAAGLILLPLIAMRFTQDVAWRPGDFVFATGLVVGVGIAFEAAVRLTRNSAYRGGAAVALLAAFLLVWINLAVGIIGSEDNPANQMYFAVVGVGIVGALLGRFRAAGMMLALGAMAVAQVAVFVVALAAGLGFTGPITVFFTGLWLISAWLFREAARDSLPLKN